MNGAPLLLLTLCAVIGLVILITRFKCNAFVGLLMAAVFVGVFSGTDLRTVGKAVTDGMGAVLGSVAAIIALGSVLGKLLEQSGGARVVTDRLVAWFGERHVAWLMLTVGLTIGIAVWFSVGLILLAPVAFHVARRAGVPLLVAVLPMTAGLSVMHGLVPPHPGPVSAIQLLEADAGRTILYSLIIGVPTAILAGPVALRLLPASLFRDGPAASLPESATSGSALKPRFATTVLLMVLPVVLMMGSSLVDLGLDYLHRQQEWASASGYPWVSKLMGMLARVQPWANFVGTPVVAMLIAVLAAFWCLGIRLGRSLQEVGRFADESLMPVAGVLLVVGAGGSFSKVLDVCGAGEAMAGIMASLQLPPLALGWILAASIRIAVGSATVALTTAAGVIAPVIAEAPGVNRELLVVAIGAGSLILSHVNDGGFWFVKELFHLSVSQTLKSWTVIETLIAVTGLILALTLNALI